MQGIQVIMLRGCESRRRVISDIGVSKRSDWCFGEVNQKSNSSEKNLNCSEKSQHWPRFSYLATKLPEVGLLHSILVAGGHLVEEKDGFCIEEDGVEVLVTAGRILRARRHLIWDIYNLVGFITI